MIASARLFAAALALALAPAPAAAAPRIEAQIATMKPGGYVWQGERAPVGPVEIVISLGLQRAYVFRDGSLIGASTISSGKKGAESPIGRFQILEKKRVHRSNRYNEAPMPFMQRLNWFGVALHAGDIPGYPASHGCIRLPAGFAKHLFGATELGSFVWVADEPISSPEAALALARANVNAPYGPGREPRGGGAQSAARR
jgi:hypothetical protein